MVRRGVSTRDRITGILPRELCDASWSGVSVVVIVTVATGVTVVMGNAMGVVTMLVRRVKDRFAIVCAISAVLG